MSDDKSYPIRYVSQFTGIPAHVIRAWERRYAAVTPHRTPTNRRLYSERDIKRLQLLRKAVHDGHSISQIASLNDEDLIAAINPDAAIQPGSPVATPPAHAPVLDNAYLNACLAAVLNLDRPTLEKALHRASIDLPRMRLINEVIVPLFATIGRRWADGSLKIINEHMASAVVRSFLDDLLRSVHPHETAPKILVATPAGQWHDIGALIIALVAAESGWQPLYFGPNLPAEEIAAAAEKTRARAVAVSVTHSVDDDRIVGEILKLREMLAEKIPLYIGGAAAAAFGAELNAAGVTSLTDLQSFRRELDGIDRRT